MDVTQQHKVMAIVVATEDGCNLFDVCLTCPLPLCQLEVSLLAQIRLARKGVILEMRERGYPNYWIGDFFSIKHASVSIIAREAAVSHVREQYLSYAQVPVLMEALCEAYPELIEALTNPPEFPEARGRKRKYGSPNLSSDTA